MASLRLSALGFILLAACAGTVTTRDGRALRLSSPAFREYVEQVFREQNQVVTALAFAQADASGSRFDTLIELEDELLAACAELNALAVARRDDVVLGLRQQARMAATAPDCESTTARSRQVLNTL